MRNVTNIFICNLAVSDILLAAFVLPQKIHDISHEEHFHEGEFLCKFVNSFPVLCITSSIYTLVGISFERRKAIAESSKPQWTLRKVSQFISLIWLFSTLVSVPTMVEYSVAEIYDNERNSSYLSCTNIKVPRLFSLFNGISILCVSYIIPLIFMWFNYLKLAWFVWKKSKEVSPTGLGNLNADTSNNPFVLFKHRVKIVKMLILVAGLFAVSWLPYFLSMVTMKITGEDDSENAGSSLNLIKIFLATFSTAYNVVLYVIFNSNFRRGFRSILCCCLPPNDVGVTMVDRTATVAIP
ncbi:hypothetical protein ScPMuIL_004922 [Solemya velum]